MRDRKTAVDSLVRGPALATVLAVGLLLAALPAAAAGTGSISGRVTGPAGEPLEGVEVRASLLGIPGWVRDIATPPGEKGGLRGWTLTDADGRFELTGLPASPVPCDSRGAFQLSFSPPEESGYVPVVRRGGEVNPWGGAVPVEADKVVTVDMRLGSLASISGTVRTWDGAGVGDATVRAILVIPGLPTFPMWSTTTDGLGRYVVTGLADAEYYIEVIAPVSPVPIYYPGTAEPARVRPLPGSRMAGADITIREPGSISGTLSSSGTILVFGPHDEWHWFERSFPAGPYSFDGLQPGNYKLGLRTGSGWAPFFYPGDFTLEDAGVVSVGTNAETDGIDLGPLPPGAMTGRVVDQDGTPLEGVEVSVVGVDFYTLCTEPSVVLSGPDGIYSVEGRGSAKLHFGRRGYLRNWYPGVGSEGEATVLAFRSGESLALGDAVLRTLGEPGGISGRVTASGLPLEGAVVEVRESAADADALLSAATDASGTYNFAGVPPGSYLLRFADSTPGTTLGEQWYPGAVSAAAAGPVVVDPGLVTAGVDADLGALGGIEGFVTVGGLVDFPGGRPMVRLHDPAGNKLQEVWCSADGHYAFGGLAPGDYLVAYDVQMQYSGGQWFQGKDTPLDAETVHVGPGAAVGSIDADLVPLGYISGSVLDPNGACGSHQIFAADAASGEVVAWAGPEPSMDHLGSYRLRLPPGSYLVHAMNSFSYRTVAAQWYPGAWLATEAGVIDVLPGQEVTGIDFVMEDLGVNQAPVLADPGAIAAAEGEAYTLTLSATDANGDLLTFAAEGLPAGAVFEPYEGTFAWTPSCTGAGSYADVRFTVTDHGEPPLSDEATVPVSVSARNCAPVLADPGAIVAAEGQAYELTLSATDGDGDRLTFAAEGLPAEAVFDPAEGRVAWTPSCTGAGSYADVRFTVTDDGEPPLSDEVTVPVSVAARSCAPSLDPVGPHETIVGEPLVFQLGGTDPDGGPVAFAATGLPDGAALDPGDGTFSWTPAGSQAGVFQVTFAAVDVEDPLLRDEETAEIAVLGPLLFRDDFSHADQAGDPDWVASSGQWSVRGGTFLSGRGGTAIALAGPASLAGDAFAAGRIEARARIARRGRREPNVGFVFAYRDAGHFRYVRFLAGRTEIGQVGGIDGQPSARVRSRRGIAPGRWQRVRVDLQPNGIVRVYAGSRAVGTLRFGAPATGGAGVLARRSASSVDDFALWARTVLE